MLAIGIPPPPSPGGGALGGGPPGSLMPARPSGAKYKVKSYFPVSPVISTTGRSNWRDKSSASPDIGCLLAVMRTFPFIRANDTAVRPAAAGGNTGKPSLSIAGLPGAGKGPSAGPPSPSLGAGSSADSFSFGPFFPTTSAYMGKSFFSRWSVSLKRSANRFCSITMNSALVAPRGSFATMSYLSESSQLGPEIWKPFTPYAFVRTPFTVTLLYVIWPGSGVPGPPRIPTRIRLPTIGAAGLTDATSNVGEFSAVCAKAAQHVRTTRPALRIARNIIDASSPSGSSLRGR